MYLSIIPLSTRDEENPNNYTRDHLKKGMFNYFTRGYLETASDYARLQPESLPLLAQLQQPVQVE